MKKFALYFLSLFILTGCPGPTTPFGENFWLDFDDIAVMQNDSLTLSFIDVSDSRCPIDVICIWEGEVVVTLLAIYGDSDDRTEEEVELVLNGGDAATTVSFASYEVVLLNVNPYPDTRVATSKEDYGIELIVNMVGDIYDFDWQLKSYNVEGGERNLLIEGSEYSLYLESGSDQASGKILCNSWFSSYRLKNNSIKFGPIASTEIFCFLSSDEDVRAQTELVLNVLSSANSFRLSDGALTIASSTGDELHYVDKLAVESKVLASAMELWEQSGINHYSFVYREICFCIPMGSGFVRVTVKDGVVIGAYDEVADMPLTEAQVDRLRTFDELFELLQRAIDQSAYSINATYSELYGFPQDVYIDYEAMIADEEYGFAVSGFSPLR